MNNGFNEIQVNVEYFCYVACYRDNNHKKSKELYQTHIKFCKRHVKLMSFRKKGLKFSIKLIGSMVL